MAACNNGHIEIARLLVEKGANLDTVNEYAGPFFVEAQLRTRFCTAVGGSRTGIDRRALGFGSGYQVSLVRYPFRCVAECVEDRSGIPALGG